MFSGEGWPSTIVWALYIGLGLIFLALLWWPLRHRPRWLQCLLLSVASGIVFTPLPIEPGSPHWAPAALVMIFDLEDKGVDGLWRGFWPMLMATFGFLLISLSLYARPEDQSDDRDQTTMDDDAL